MANKGLVTESLTEINHLAVVVAVLIEQTAEGFQGLAVKSDPGRVAGDPLTKSVFVGAFFVTQTIFAKAQALALVVFVRIHAGCIGRGQGNTDFVILVHVLFVSLHATANHVFDHHVDGGQIKIQVIGTQVTIRRPWVTHDHGIISVLDPGGANRKVTVGFEGNVTKAVVFGRFSVGAGINTKDRKVTGMAGPHPVVGIAAEFADAAGGCTHQANIFVNHVNRKNKLVSVENGSNIALITLLFGRGLVSDDFANLGDHRTALGFGDIAKGVVHSVGHILHTDQG